MTFYKDKGIWTDSIADAKSLSDSWPPEVCVVSGDDEWSALYIKGKLVIANDHYYADERIRDYFGVVTVSSDAFFLDSSKSDVHETLDGVLSRETATALRADEAEDLRRQAAELLAKADALSK